MQKLASLFVFALGATACSSSNSETTAVPPAPIPGCTASLAPSADDTGATQGALLDAKAGSVVCFHAGTYHFTDELSLSASNVTVRGEPGTVLDFSTQKSGGNALAI